MSNDKIQIDEVQETQEFIVEFFNTVNFYRDKHNIPMGSYSRLLHFAIHREIHDMGIDVHHKNILNSPRINQACELINSFYKIHGLNHSINQHKSFKSEILKIWRPDNNAK